MALEAVIVEAAVEAVAAVEVVEVEMAVERVPWAGLGLGATGRELVCGLVG